MGPYLLFRTSNRTLHLTFLVPGLFLAVLACTLEPVLFQVLFAVESSVALLIEFFFVPTVQKMSLRVAAR